MNISQSIDNTAKKALEHLGTVPTTNVRILVTLGVVIGTAIRYWTSATWVPNWNWLMFMCLMSGLDVTQFIMKRKTAWGNGDTSPTEDTKPTTGQ